MHHCHSIVVWDAGTLVPGFAFADLCKGFRSLVIGMAMHIIGRAKPDLEMPAKRKMSFGFTVNFSAVLAGALGHVDSRARLSSL